jgi:PAS domain S-box-containing protein
MQWRGVDASRIPVPKSPAGWVLAWLALAGAYFAAARFGLSLTFVHSSASPVWPPTGLALAALLLLGWRAWPGVALGAYLANALTTGWGLASLAIAAGNTLEALVGWWLVGAFCGGLGFLRSPGRVLRFAVLAGLGATLVSATVGVTALVATGNAPPAAALPIWTTWWLGDAAGALLVAPLVVTLATPRRPTVGHLPEALMVGTLLGVLALVAFSPVLLQAPSLFLLLPIPGLAWAALRFGPLGAAVAATVLAALAIAGTLQGYGPLATVPDNVELLAVQGYIGAGGLAALALASRRPPSPTPPTDSAAAEAVLRQRAVAIGLASAGLITALGALVLFAWFAGIDPLKSPIPGAASMKANTALGLLLLGSALLLTRRGRNPGPAASLALGLLVLLGAATLLQYLVGVDLRIDELLARDDLAAAATSSPGRMSPFTAVGLTLLGLSLLLRHRPGSARSWSDALALLGSTTGVVALAGHVFGAYLVASVTQVALHTAIALLLGGGAVLLLDPRRGLGQLAVSADIDGRLARTLPVGVLAIPLALGLVRLELERRGFITLEQGVVLTVLGTILLLALVATLTIGQARRVLAERRLVQEELRRTLASVTEAERVTGRGSWEWDVRANRAVWSDGMYRLFGVDRANFDNTNENFLAMVLPEDRETMGQAIAAAMERPGPFAQEYRLRRPDGRVVSLQGEGNVVPGADGEARLIFGVVQDVTRLRALEEERRLAEVQVRRAQERFQRVFEASPVAIVLSKEDGLVVDVNPAFCKMVGHPREALLGGQLRTPDLWEDPQERQRLIAHLRQRGAVQDFQMRLRRADGGVRTVLLSAELVDVGGSTTILALLQDVTERQRAQEERERRITTEAELERLRRTDHFKTEFINSTAHELATPLTPLVLNARLLAGDASLAPDQHRMVETMARAVERLRQVVGDMVRAADLQARTIALEKGRLDLARVLAEAVARHLDAAGRANIRLETAPGPGLAVVADERRLQLVLGHLLGNALKFTPAGGRVTVSARQDGGQARIEVADTGAGLTRTQIEELFRPYSQVHDKSQRTDSGSGLGLYVAKGIIELHNGEIGVTSAGPGKGATFWFTLPLSA